MMFTPIDLKKVQTFPLSVRENKVATSDFAKPGRAGASARDLLASLPNILAGRDLRRVARGVAAARQHNKPVVLAMGAHVIKVGLNPLIIAFMEQGLIQAIALNGAGVVHDVEVALQGATSEDVVAGLPTGRFGMVRETGELINDAVRQGSAAGKGLGRSVGERILAEKLPCRDQSILAAGVRKEVDVTVHAALGTDIVHTHPSMDGASWGAASMADFCTLCGIVGELGDGGVLLHFGSAVILPEVLLKAVTVARNVGRPVARFMSVNVDFIRQYRSQNVVERMRALEAEAISLIGHHEIMMPLLFQAILEELANG